MAWLSVVVGLASVPALAGAASAERGAQLYLSLPGGVDSCVGCHGPDPLGNRNRLLNAAQGPAAITEAIRKAAAMGYLEGVLGEADKADLSAYLARVNVLDGAALEMWPRTVEFGRIGLGAGPAVQWVSVLNTGTQPVTMAPVLVDAQRVQMSHDCPGQLQPGARCSARLSVDTGATGPVSAALRWQGDADWAPQLVGVSGAVQPLAAGVLVVDGLAAGGTPAVLALSGAPGQTVARELALVNAGLEALSLGAPALTGPGAAAFSLAGSGCAAGQVLAPGARCTLRLSATLPATGEHEALLQWRTDGAALAPLALSAQAVPASAPPAPPPVPTPVPPPAPVPAPVPVPPPVSADGAGGGCSVALDPRAADPLLPALLMLALLALGARRARRPA